MNVISISKARKNDFSDIFEGSPLTLVGQREIFGVSNALKPAITYILNVRFLVFLFIILPLKLHFNLRF